MVWKRTRRCVSFSSGGSVTLLFTHTKSLTRDLLQYRHILAIVNNKISSYTSFPNVYDQPCHYSPYQGKV